MRSKALSIVSLSTIILMVLSSSCKDDDKDPEPVVKPKLSFAELTRTVKESDGVIEVELKLDKAHDQDIVIEYALSGTATEWQVAAENNPADYEITSDYLEATITAGETSGLIEMRLISDPLVEDDEEIEISIEGVNSEDIEITRDDEIIITTQQEDGLLVILEWPNTSGDLTADMDLLLRVGSNTTTWTEIWTGSASEAYQGPEIIFVPYALEHQAYGLSYVYYDGTYDPLNFTVTFVDVVNGTLESEDQTQVFEGSYTLENINAWTSETVESTVVVQTFLKSGQTFTSPEAINVPPSGSRVGSGELLFTIEKTDQPVPISNTLSSIISRIK